MLDPYTLSPVLNSLNFGIWEFHLRMRQICRPKLYNYLFMFIKVYLLAGFNACI
jgi:hypothetical protein